MQQLGLNEIREQFLSFFEQKGHLRNPSFSLVPQNDKSLILINSGMAPLKPYFSGEVTPPSRRMCSCQKCIRTLDIENVGKTSRHGTFFEMLGNFSFGDYFKREALPWSWEFLTMTMGLDADKLYPSVYLEDDEAFDIWVNVVGVPAERVTRLGKADNFWEIGSGPCGPCSEIYFDRGEENGCGSPDCAPGCDCDRFIEVWNNVFTQFNNDGNGNYTPLAQKNIDTGMGLERLACVVQGVSNLFEVDTIFKVLQRVCALAGVTYKANEKNDVSIRIITDHTRSATMLIGDGVLPSNEGRGYILRRLLRRAARHGRLLGINGTFLHELCQTVIAESQQAYPELRERAELIVRVVATEEDNFNRTLDAGLRQLVQTTDDMKKQARSQMTGAEAFKLYDTYGFPVDLTLELLEEQALTLDREGFDALMQQQRERAREARKAAGDFSWASQDLGLDRDLKTQFIGYEQLTGEGRVLALLGPDGLCEQADNGTAVSLVLDVTPFYAESGGQVADHGTLTAKDGKVRVDDVQKTRDGKFVHSGQVIEGIVSRGDAVLCEVDAERRGAIMRAHSATHLLQAAMRVVLGAHVEQSGSYVEPDRLRFDFTHFSALTADECQRIMALVNDYVLQGHAIATEVVSLDEAKKRGAMALFGEKYGDEVRLVQMGDVSLELCGGTHAANTALVGLFSLESDSSVAAGTRRVEATVGKAVLGKLQQQSQLIGTLTEQFKTSEAELLPRVAQTLTAFQTLQKQQRAQSEQQLAQQALVAAEQANHVGSVKVMTLTLPAVDKKVLQTAGDTLKDRYPYLVALLASEEPDKVTLLAVCGKGAIEKGVKAGDVIKAATAAVNGSGGGRPDSAMGGTKEVHRVAEAMAAAVAYVEGLM